MLLVQSGATSHERMDVLQRGFEANPGSEELGVLLVYELIKREEFADAEQLLERLAHEKGDTLLTQLAKARLSLLSGDWDRVRAEYDKVISMLTPRTDARVTLNVSVDLLGIPGRREHGLDVLERLIASKPSDPAPYSTLAVAIEDQNPERARQMLSIARKMWGPRTGFEESVAEMRSAARNRLR
jgi:predicted Zn-dependent protease